MYTILFIIGCNKFTLITSDDKHGEFFKSPRIALRIVAMDNPSTSISDYIFDIRVLAC